MADINVYGTFNSMAEDQTVAKAAQIFDDVQEKTQETINSETSSRISNLNAEDISYDQTQTPDLGNGDVQSAIEALNSQKVEYTTIENSDVQLLDGNLSNIYPATSAGIVTYDNTSSGLSASDVQDAIDEVVDDVDNKIDRYIDYREYLATNIATVNNGTNFTNYKTAYTATEDETVIFALKLNSNATTSYGTSYTGLYVKKSDNTSIVSYKCGSVPYTEISKEVTLTAGQSILVGDRFSGTYDYFALIHSGNIDELVGQNTLDIEDLQEEVSEKADRLIYYYDYLSTNIATVNNGTSFSGYKTAYTATEDETVIFALKLNSEATTSYSSSYTVLQVKRSDGTSYYSKTGGNQPYTEVRLTISLTAGQSIRVYDRMSGTYDYFAIVYSGNIDELVGVNVIDIRDLKEDVSDVSDVIYEDSDVLYQLTMTNGLYYDITSDAVGTNVATELANPDTSNANYQACLIDCKEGDRFRLSSYHGTGRGWVFVNSVGTILSKDTTASATTTTHELTAPANSAKLMYQTYKNRSLYGYRYYDGYKTLSDRVWTTETYGDRVDTLEDEVDTLNAIVGATSGDDIAYNVQKSTYKTLRLTFAMFSDLHLSSASLTLVNTILTNYSTYINEKIFGGDLNNYYEQSLSWWTSTAPSCLFVVGNHEIQDDSTYAKTDHIGLDVYNKFISPYITSWGTLGIVSVSGGSLVYDADNPSGANLFQLADSATNGYSFFFKDYTTQGVRLIVLDWTNYNTAQKEWMQATLADALTNNYAVVVASHYPSTTMTATRNSFDSYGGSSEQRSSPWLSVFSEYDAHEDIQDFIDAGGTFVCWLCGHTHRDGFSYLTSNPQQYVINITSANTAITETDLIMTDTAVNLYSIDTNIGYLYINRIGANTDFYGRKREALVWDYVNRKLIREVK